MDGVVLGGDLVGKRVWRLIDGKKEEGWDGERKMEGPRKGSARPARTRRETKEGLTQSTAVDCASPAPALRARTGTRMDRARARASRTCWKRERSTVWRDEGTAVQRSPTSPIAGLGC